MTEIVTTSLPGAIVTLWDRPPETNRISHDPASPPIPFGEVVFSGVEVIPAKILTDTSKWQLTCTIPRGYVYLLHNFTVFADSTTVVLDDFEKGMRILINGNPGDPGSVFVDGLVAYNATTHFFGTATSPNSVQNNATGAAAKIASFLIPAEAWPRTPIVCAGGDGTFNLSWFDMSGDSSALVNATFRISFLMYTIEQLRNFALHSPILSYPS